MTLRSRALLATLACLFAMQTALPLGAAPKPKPTKTPAAPKFMAKASKGETLYATFVTTKGNFVVKLFSKDAPKTVANFVGLATGEKEWLDPRTGARSHKPLYSGTIFHRVIATFMIQGGDPLGTGAGSPGYRFNDEFNGMEFDRPGLLAMANSGPNTNGSQFFVTVSRPRHLNDRHTIFGVVISGYDVVQAIATVPTGDNDRPVKDVVVKRIDISETAPKEAPKKAAPAKGQGER